MINSIRIKVCLLLLSGIALVGKLSAKRIEAAICKGWQFRQAGQSTWMPASVPGTVHTDLMAAGRIPDPFYRDNEHRVQWVGMQDWEYAATFSVGPQMLARKHVALVFEGLDTYAAVYVNDRLLLQADNMFRTWEVDVKSSLKPGSNKLRIVFRSAARMADSLAKAALPLVRPSENNRHYVRKAQYHFGWDWAPKLLTCGVWRPVRLCAYDEPSVAVDWQHGHDRVALVQQPDSLGRSFYFRVNDQPVFMKGANWVPADVFLPRVTKAKYRQLLIAAKDAHFNMLRVWGGGVYEDDTFYDLCDSLGIMVWQDFMFAGAIYPGDAHFIENITREAIDNITRLRRHKCIVLWCGNNEIDEAWHNWGWQRQFHLSTADSARLWADYTRLFKETLPSIVRQYDGTRPYIETSPAIGWGRKESLTHGDSHYWGVWWGLAPIDTYKVKVPRFMSEYGMQAMPAWESIRRFSLPRDWDTGSAVMRIHQKHPTGYKTLAVYLAQNKLKATSFKAFAAATQQVQAKALATAITAHRQAAPYCMGTLFWQFNDCWPVSSWSIIDYYGRKKKAYRVVKMLYRE